MHIDDKLAEIAYILAIAGVCAALSACSVHRPEFREMTLELPQDLSSEFGVRSVTVSGDDAAQFEERTGLTLKTLSDLRKQLTGGGSGTDRPSLFIQHAPYEGLEFDSKELLNCATSAQVVSISFGRMDALIELRREGPGLDECWVIVQEVGRLQTALVGTYVH